MDGLVGLGRCKFVLQPTSLDICWRRRRCCSIVCRNGARGFDSKRSSKKETPKQSQPQVEVPDVFTGQKKSNGEDDARFEKRLQELRMSAMEQKKIQEEKMYGPVDYDSPPQTGEKKDNLLIKVGGGVALLGLIISFAVGDYLPSGSSNGQNTEVYKKLRPEEESKLKTELDKYEEVLKASPDEPSALEGASVAYAELGQYKNAEANLEKLVKINDKDVEAWRLLAEVRSALENYEGSSVAYAQAMKVSDSDSMGLLRGLTEALIKAKKPGEAVDVLLEIKQKKLKSAEQVKIVKADEAQKEAATTDADALDPLQVDLLLGKAYSSWNRPVDALAVYDGLTKRFPDDFRGYLAKGVFLKEQGRGSEAERMFIQARYFAPAKAKLLVDRYAK